MGGAEKGKFGKRCKASFAFKKKKFEAEEWCHSCIFLLIEDQLLQLNCWKILHRHDKSSYFHTSL